MENLAHRLEADAIMAAQCVGMPFEFRNTQEFVGREGFRLFYDFVYSDLMTNGGYVSVANFDERLFCDYYGEEPKSNRHIARMNDMIRLRDESYCMNLLVCEGGGALHSKRLSQIPLDQKAAIYAGLLLRFQQQSGPS